MKFETFKILIESSKEQYQKDFKKISRIENAIGGETQIDLFNDIYDNIVQAIVEEFELDEIQQKRAFLETISCIFSGVGEMNKNPQTKLMKKQSPNKALK